MLPALVYPHPILDEPWDGRRLQDTIVQGDDRVVVDTRGHHAQTNAKHETGPKWIYL